MKAPVRKWIWGISVGLLSLTLLALLLSQIRLADILRLTGKLTFEQILLLVGLFLIATVFRGLRLACLLKERQVMALTAISGVHSLLNHLLPFRTGDLSLPFLLRVFMRHSLATGTFSWVVVRIYDVLSVAILMLLSLAVVHTELLPGVAVVLGYALFAVTVALLVAFFSLPLILRIAGRWLPSCGRVFGARGVSMARRLAVAAEHVREQLLALTARQRYLVLPATSLLNQGSVYAFFYLAMRFLGIDIGFFLNMLASSGELITGLLPINMVGSIGTLEAGWAAGYVLCGVNRVDAIATGFVVHGLILLSFLSISLLGMAYLMAARSLRR